MFKNLLLTSVRNFLRQPVYSAINTIGLTVAMAVSILIFLWVLDEVSFDKVHADRNRIFGLFQHVTYPDARTTTYGSSPAPMAAVLQAELPEIEYAVRTSDTERFRFTAGSNTSMQRGIFADPSLFNTFTVRIRHGNPALPLPDSRSIAIAQSMATALFGSSDAVGQSLRLNGNTDLRVSAVFENLPPESSLRFDFVIPYDLLATEFKVPMDWGRYDAYIYLKLHSEADADKVTSKIEALIRQKPSPLPLVSGDGSESMAFFLFPLTDWHLRSNFENGKQTGGRIVYVVSFSLAGAILLLIGCINFMNLATARAARRAKEIGIRKVVGASRTSLLRKFLSESMLTSFACLLIALLFVHLTLPLFNGLTGKHLHVDYSNVNLSGGLLLIAAITGLVAGSYPALFLSSLKPAAIIKGETFTHLRGASLRKSLVLIQFSIAVAMIVGAQVVNRQIHFIRSKDLGYDRNQVVYFTPGERLVNSYESFRNELLNNPAIVSAGQADTNPMTIFNNDFATWPGIPETDPQTVQTSTCDADYLQTLGFTLKDGRFFSRDLASDASAFIINESMAGRMGQANAVGIKMKVYQYTGHVVGVVKDFNNNNLHAGIDPVIFLLTPSDAANPMTVFVRYAPGKESEALTHLRSVYKKFEPDYPLELEYLDSTFERAYRGDILMGNLSIWFTGVAIAISCLGLFGLALFTTERRVKEIGIRKVLGASVSNLVVMICAEFARPVMMATVLGSLLSWYFVNGFLEQYAFHASLGVEVFATSAGVLASIAFITVIHQSMKAAKGNPVEALRING